MSQLVIFVHLLFLVSFIHANCQPCQHRYLTSLLIAELLVAQFHFAKCPVSLSKSHFVSSKAILLSFLTFVS